MGRAEAILSGSFVGGLQAISLTEDGEVPAIADYSEAEVAEESLGATEESDVSSEAQEAVEDSAQVLMNEAAMEAWREEERQKLKAEITGAERLAMKIELEKAVRTQADVILEQARAQGEQVKVKAKLAAEAERLEILEAARNEGYEDGRQRLLQEQEALEASFAEKERFLEAEYEKKQRELEPMTTNVIIKLVEGLTGACLETKKGIVTYLVTKALSEADRSNTFLVKVSKDDIEEVKGAAEGLRSLFEREVTLEVVQDALLKKGECMIETDSNIIDCSLGTQLEGLLEDIRLLSVQERV